MLRGRFKIWNTINYPALSKDQHLLAEDNQVVLENLASSKNAKLRGRIRRIKACGIYRQTRMGTLPL
jgi:hypothetical protein